jgi:lipocalin
MFSYHGNGNWMQIPRMDHIRASEFQAALADYLGKVKKETAGYVLA